MSALNSPSLCLRFALLALAALIFAGDTATMAAAGELPAIASRQRAEKKSFTDAEIVDGFLKTAFGAEYHLAGRVDRIRKFDGPVRVLPRPTAPIARRSLPRSWPTSAPACSISTSP